MIEARALTRAFGGRPAVTDLSFQVGPGEVVGFLGPNGAGKTTALRMLLGLIAPDSGAVTSSARSGISPSAIPPTTRCRLAPT